MKKFLSLFLAFAVILSCTVVGSAASGAQLRFDKSGEFKILHLTDCQDVYPATENMMKFIGHTLDKYKPDLVVLGGDNTVGASETKREAIAELVAPFVERGIYFTLVFGNHDHEQGVDNAALLQMYQTAGGEYCLARDDAPEVSGVGNHVLSVLSASSDKPAYNLYMFDSGSYYTDGEGHSGYGFVQADQIEWFEKTNNAFTSQNGGKLIPSLVFQHIVVGEVMDVFYGKNDADKADYFCNGRLYNVGTPEYTSVKSGLLKETPCPGVENHGQLAAMVRQGVVAGFFGHDHVNSYTVNIEGVDIVNTPGATYNSYNKDSMRGCRLITLHEGETKYDSQIISIARERARGAKLEGSRLKAFNISQKCKKAENFVQFSACMVDLFDFGCEKLHDKLERAADSVIKKVIGRL